MASGGESTVEGKHEYAPFDGNPLVSIMLEPDGGGDEDEDDAGVNNVGING